MNKQEENLGIVVDAMGAGPLFMVKRPKSKAWLQQKYQMNVQLI